MIERLDKQIEALRIKKRKLERKRSAILAAGTRQERKRQARAKIIVGAALIAGLSQGVRLTLPLPISPRDIAYIREVMGDAHADAISHGCV